jgi:hypothetical protein
MPYQDSQSGSSSKDKSKSKDKSSTAPGQNGGGAMNTALRGWLSAMKKSGKIKAGGKLLFVNRKTGTAVPLRHAEQNDALDKA